MANKEYSSRASEFWHSLAMVFSVVPVLMVIGFVVAYFIGTFRPDYIRKGGMQNASDPLGTTRRSSRG